MNLKFISACLAVVLALFVSGCETDGGVSARAHEKAATYAGLKVWQKRLIDKATISQGFTPDMVYIAMGPPSKVETKEDPRGHVELWTYHQFYPNVDAVHGFRRADYTLESAYQPQKPRTMTAPGADPNGPFAPQVPIGMGSMKETVFKTGGPQGSSMEPADLRSYTIQVLFAAGKVVQIGADENP